MARGWGSNVPMQPRRTYPWRGWFVFQVMKRGLLEATSSPSGGAGEEERDVAGVEEVRERELEEEEDVDEEDEAASRRRAGDCLTAASLLLLLLLLLASDDVVAAAGVVEEMYSAHDFLIWSRVMGLRPWSSAARVSKQ